MHRAKGSALGALSSSACTEIQGRYRGDIGRIHLGALSSSACTTKLAVGCWAMGLRLGPSAACSRCHHGAPPTRSSACHCGGLGVGVGGSGWVLELV